MIEGSTLLIEICQKLTLIPLRVSDRRTDCCENRFLYSVRISSIFVSAARHWLRGKIKTNTLLRSLVTVESSSRHCPRASRIVSPLGNLGVTTSSMKPETPLH